MSEGAEQAVARAAELIRAGRHSEAFEAYAECLGRELCAEDRGRLLGERAWLLRSLGRLDEALQDYDTLAATAPSNAAWAAARAETLLMAGQPEPALRAAIVALGLDPKEGRAARVIARSHEALGIGIDDSNRVGGVIFPPPAAASSSINPVIERLESDAASFPTSVHPLVGRVLGAVTQCVRPAMAIEVGSYIGYSSLCIAQAMEIGGAGHLHAFDLFNEIASYVSPVIGPCADSLAAARAHAHHAGLGDRITFHRGDSSAMIREVFAGKRGVVDLAFIDGDHTVRGAFKDWDAIDPLLSDGAVALLHDSTPSGTNGWQGPRALLDEILERGQGAYQWVNLPTPDGFGMAIVQKTTGTFRNWRPSISSLAAQWLHYRIEEIKRR